MDNNRKGLLNIKVEGCGPLVLTRLDGYEELSRPFLYKMTVISEKALDLLKLLCNSVSAFVDNKLSQHQYFHGLIRECSLVDDSYGYVLHVEPWFAFLQETRDYRIYQNKTIPEIIVSVFKEYGFVDYDISGLKKDYQKLPYCTRYDESAFDFVSRLLEEVDVFYIFKHSESKHIMIISDDLNQLPVCQEKVKCCHEKADGVYLCNWEEKQKLVTTKMSASTFQSETLPFVISEEVAIRKPRATLECYEDHLPSYNMTRQSLRHYIKSKLRAKQKDYKSFKSKGNIVGLNAGTIFSLQSEPGSQYVIHKIIHKARGLPLYNETYSNNIECYSREGSYVSKEKMQKPKRAQLNLATVTGMQGKEVYSHGAHEIKAQFHWDRVGNFDEKSSCWIKVRALQAGNRFGTQFLPRVGQEVLVKFVHGNPDKPCVVASVANNGNYPAFTLPTNKSQSGFKTHTLESGNSQKYNQISFDDRQSKEEIFIKAQKDMKVYAKKDSKITVKQDAKCTIKNGNWVSKIAGIYAITAEQELSITVGGSKVLLNRDGVTFEADTITIMSSDRL